MKKTKCDDCGKPAIYYTQSGCHTSLWEIGENGKSYEINCWTDENEPPIIHYCQKCAEAEGLI